jgi:electron transport complex protein RnfC
MRPLYTFHGGIHPPSNKTQSTRLAIAHAPLPSKLIVPFHQHAGEAAKPVVQAGDHVLKGQLIGMPDGLISSAVHASTSGTITAIGAQPIAHPSGLPDLCATLIPDGREEWIPMPPLRLRSGQDLITATAILPNCAGSCACPAWWGLGGAVFPSHLKVNPGKKGKLDTLVINGAECEPLSPATTC